MRPRGLGYLFLRGPVFNTQSAQLSRKFPCDMAVSSGHKPCHLSTYGTEKQRVHISRWHYGEYEPLGQVSNQCFSIM